MHSAWFAPLFAEPALDRFRVIRPVRPGYGRSTVPSTHYGLADHARACSRLLRELGVERAHSFGLSSSCCIALQAALDDPALVAGLVLFEPAKPNGSVRDRAAATYVGPAMAAAAEGDIPRAFDIFGRRGRLRRRPARPARRRRDAAAVRESAYFFADEMPALREWGFGPAEGAAVTVPALIMRGEQSRPWFGENAEILAGMMPGAETVTVPGVGHLGPLTHPAEIASAIADFVGRNTPVRAPA